MVRQLHRRRRKGLAEHVARPAPSCRTNSKDSESVPLENDGHDRRGHFIDLEAEKAAAATLAIDNEV